MNYYDEIDPIGEEKNECLHCGYECTGAYCSTACKNYDLQ
jgi:hypothetical protein